jgi:hypothetical protein
MSSFDPAQLLRGDLSHVKKGDDQGDGIGTDEKGQTPMLRLITSKQGFQWLHYATLSWGDQSEDGTWFDFYYNGLIKYEGKLIVGDWLVKVRGTGLELICYKISKHVRSLLKVGSTANSQQQIVVESILIEPTKLEGQDD